MLAGTRRKQVATKSPVFISQDELQPSTKPTHLFRTPRHKDHNKLPRLDTKIKVCQHAQTKTKEATFQKYNPPFVDSKNSLHPVFLKKIKIN